MKYQNPIKKLEIIFSFYRNFIVISFLISVWCLYMYFKYGVSILSTILWFKIATLTLIYFFTNEYKAKEYFYYQNLGFSKLVLWITTLLFDFSLMILLTFLISYFK